jgi:hypothetical protein
MIEPELKQILNEIHSSVVRLDKGRWWKSLLDGIFRGVGSIIGVTIAILIIGWVLNVIGIIPSFRQEVDRWRGLLQETQKQLPIQNQIDLN